MLKTIRIFLFLAFLFSSQSALPGVTPISIAIIPPLEFPPDGFSVAGLRVSGIWGNHRDLYGFDIGGIGNITQQHFVGLGVAGLFNQTLGVTTVLGLQAAGLFNSNEGDARVVGLQVAAGINYQKVKSSVTGFEIALVNLGTFTSVYGFQIGLYNRSFSVYGFQIGLINVADSVHGLQIGLLNFNKSGVFAVAPGINFGI